MLLHHVTHRGSRNSGLALIVLKPYALVVLSHRSQAQADSLLCFVHLDDFEVHLLIEGQQQLLAFRLPLAGFRRDFTLMAQPFHSGEKLNKNAKLSGAADSAPHAIANLMCSEESLPRIGLKLLDPQRETPARGVDVENHSLNHLALFH